MASLLTPYLDTLLLQPQVSMQAVATGKQIFSETKLSSLAGLQTGRAQLTLFPFLFGQTI